MSQTQQLLLTLVSIVHVDQQSQTSIRERRFPSIGSFGD